VLSNQEKKELVEQGIKEFSINPKFRKLLNWFIDEMDKVYEKRLNEQIKIPKNAGIYVFDR